MVCGLPQADVGFSVRRAAPAKRTPKHYVEGARASELPIPRPDGRGVLAAGARIRLPVLRRSRSRRFRRLPCCHVPGYCPIALDANDPDTVDCAIKQRLLRTLPEADEAVLSEFEAFVYNWVIAHVPVARELTFEEWLASTSYSESRKQELREVFQRLLGGPPTERQCSHVDSFVKTESYPELKHARMINSRSDAFKVFSGPLFKAVEEVLYQLPQFIKHVPVPERPEAVKRLRKHGYKTFATDFTAYESHFVPKLMNLCECVLYRHCLRWSAHVDLLCRTLIGTNRTRTRTGIRMNVKGRRMSGDMCTSLGNGFTNLMLAKFIAYRKGGELDGLVEGDDGLFVTNIDLTSQDYAQLGFTIKIEEVLDPCEASFCGMIFSESGEIIKDPRKFLQTFGWTSSFVHAGERIMLELLRAKALSTVYETPQCPIIGAVARYALSQTAGYAPRQVADGYHEVNLGDLDSARFPKFSPSPDTRFLFQKRYGVSVETQLSIEKCVMAGDFGAVGRLLPPPPAVAWFAARYTVTD